MKHGAGDYKNMMKSSESFMSSLLWSLSGSNPGCCEWASNPNLKTSSYTLEFIRENLVMSHSSTQQGTDALIEFICQTYSFTLFKSSLYSRAQHFDFKKYVAPDNHWSSWSSKGGEHQIGALAMRPIYNDHKIDLIVFIRDKKGGRMVSIDVFSFDMKIFLQNMVNMSVVLEYSPRDISLITKTLNAVDRKRVDIGLDIKVHQFSFIWKIWKKIFKRPSYNLANHGDLAHEAASSWILAYIKTMGFKVHPPMAAMGLRSKQ